MLAAAKALNRGMFAVLVIVLHFCLCADATTFQTLHSWNFMGHGIETSTVADHFGDATATLFSGAELKPVGVKLDGVDDYVGLNINTAFGGELTIETVASVNNLTASSVKPFFSCSNGELNEGDNIGLTTAPALIGNDNLVARRSHHIVATVSTSTITTYIDGFKVSQAERGDALNTMVRTQCYIGRSAFSAHDFLDGVVSYLAIHQGVMTAGEVKMAFEASIRPRHWWSFEGLIDGNTTTADDHVGGETATIYGATFALGGITLSGEDACVAQTDAGGTCQTAAVTSYVALGSSPTGSLSGLGGAMTLEFFAAFNAFERFSALFACGNPDQNDYIEVRNKHTRGMLELKLYRGTVKIASASSLTNQDLEIGKMHHIVVTFKGFAISLFLDGKLVLGQSERQSESNPLYPSVEPNVVDRSHCVLGESGWKSPGHFKGKIAMAAIYLGAMTPEDVTRAYFLYSGPAFAATGLAPFQITNAFCGTSEWSKIPVPCYVEGGDTLTIYTSLLPNMTNIIMVKINSRLCTEAVAITPLGQQTYAMITCITPCFTDDGSSVTIWGGASLELSVSILMTDGETIPLTKASSFPVNAVQLRSGYSNTQNYPGYVCSDPPNITSVTCALEGCLGSSQTILEVPPNMRLIVTGHNFGATQQVTTLGITPNRLSIANSACIEAVILGSWSSTQFEFSMCAAGGSDLPLQLELGSMVSNVVRISVLVSATVPRSLHLLTKPTTSAPLTNWTLLTTWEPPQLTASLSGYILKYVHTTVRPVNEASWAAGFEEMLSNSTTEFNVSLSLGQTVWVKIGAFYSPDTKPHKNDFTALQVSQAASAPGRATITSIAFVGLSTTETGANMLIQFEMGSFNGVSPHAAAIGFSHLSDSNITVGESQTIALNEKNVQLVVLSGVPVRKSLEFKVNLQAMRSQGLAGGSVKMTSTTSDVWTLQIDAPTEVRDLKASLNSCERDSDKFSVTLDWKNGEDRVTVGNSSPPPITAHTVYARRESSPCNKTDNSLETLTCIQAANSDASYWVVPNSTASALPRATVRGLPLGQAACFVVQAANAVGSGPRSSDEVCIDVSTTLQNRCDEGSSLIDPRIFSCEKCPLGTFSNVKGGTCKVCLPLKYTPAPGATECVHCSEGKRADFSSSLNLTTCVCVFVFVFREWSSFDFLLRCG